LRLPYSILDVRRSVMIYDVHLIPQTSDFSCWAASIAMILGWRNSASYDPSLIATNFGGTNYMPQFNNGLSPNDTYILQRNGFRVLSPQCYTVRAVRHLLSQFGPLWVAGLTGGPHIRVATGLTAGRVHVNDPWPPFHGAQYTRSFSSFFGDMETLGASEMNQPAPVYVAHLMC
jgi:hypothetical protein